MIAILSSFRALAVALPLGLAAVSPAAAQAVLDDFLAGLDAGCTRTDAFQAWQDGLVATHVPQNGVTARSVDLGPVAAAIGPARAVDKDEWVEVSVPLSGTFRGVAVRRLVFSFGKENGIYAYALEFAAPEAEVRAAFEARVKASAAMLPKGDDGMVTTTDLDFGGRAALFCDFSN